jgi:hypothetical protein
MIDLTNPEYQQLFMSLVYLKFEVDEERNCIIVDGVEYSRTNPDVQYIVDMAVEASQEMIAVMQRHYEKVFESNRGLVH